MAAQCPHVDAVVAVHRARDHIFEAVEEGAAQTTGQEPSDGRSLLEELAFALTASFHGALILDAQFRIIAANATAAEVLGFDAPADLVGRSLDHLAAEVGLPPLAARLRDEGGLAEAFEVAKPAERVLELRARTTPSGLGFMAVRDVTPEHRRRWGDAIYEALAKVLSESTTHADALHKLLGALGTALEWSAADLFRVDRDAGVMRFETTWVEGRSDVSRELAELRTVELPRTQPTVGAAWTTRRPVWREDLNDDPGLQIRAALSEGGFKSALAYPVPVGGEIVGVLVFFSKTRRPCDDGILRLLTALDPVIGQFLERLRLFDIQNQLHRERERALERLNVLHGVTTALAGAVRIEEVARVILTASIDALKATTSVLYLFDPDREELWLADHIGFRQAGNPAFQRFGLDRPGPIVEAVRAHRTVIVDRAEDMARRYPQLYAAIGEGYETWIALPCIAHDEVIGAIGLTFDRPQTFAPEDRSFLDMLAWKCALALDRARLFEAERIGKEQALAEQKRFRDILMSAPIPVVVYEGPEHVVSMVNTAYLEILRRAGETQDPVGKPYRTSTTVLREAAEKITKDLDRIYTTGQALTFAEYPVPLPSPEGQLETHYFASSAQPMRDANGRVTGIVQLAVDITDQVLARQRHEAARAEAEAETRAKDQFLAMLSHELRTPLQSMLGWTQLLLSRPFEPTTFRRGLETIERNTRQQARLIEQLLDVSRIVAGKLSLDKRPLELAELVETAVESLRTEAQQKEISLTVRRDHPVHVFADPDRLRQIVFNLVGNALKFTPAGGCVTVSVEPDRTEVELKVSDTGRGIPPAMLRRIFKPFHQLGTGTKGPQEGLGLGLSIVRHLVEQHGGRVRAESEGEGRGATFIVTLPRLERRATNEAVEQPSVPDEVRNGMVGLQVLVIDDDPDTAEVIAMALRQVGAEVRVATSGREAVSLFREQHPGLVISDLALRDADGFEVLRCIRRMESDLGWPRSPAIALTGLATREDHEKALRAGYKAHLAKPIAPDDLLCVIGEVLRAKDEPGRRS